ncbi:FCD domain-containing protein [Breoghania sp. L-A4]|uniref:FadR/GntR family transcriptional regulator n=1 Tax=Breoghania sp. L-A4 TaxID=2304600 RepID=UPI000E360B5C|nr:FCD domain-containing protein [Breoghania sp. L-A4]AXS42735.1 FadR family transcriptional regulator [Breoghania sp. L-A4]
MLTRPESSERENAIAAMRAFIESSAYGPGDRLPAERELIGHLQISRTTLRKALDALEREGVIWRHVGKGTFVSGHSQDNGLGTIGSLAGIAQQLTPVRMMRARLCIEPAIAGEAAVNASKEAVTRVKLAMDRARRAQSWADYETQDDLFHRSVAEASDNILLISLFEQLNRVRRAVAVSTVIRNTDRPPEGHSSFLEHERIVAAITDRDSKAAYDAMRRHIGSVSARLFGEV